MNRNDTVRAVAERLSIAEVIGEYVSLKRSGSNFLGLCPFHGEKTPSFNVNPAREIFHCFGCGKHGTIVDFCKEYFALNTKIEAVLMLCQKYNIKNTEDLILEGIKNISKKVDMQRICENENIRVSNLCRMLLRKSFAQHKTWVVGAYKKLNQAMDEENIDVITRIGEKASKLLRGNSE